MELFGRLVHVPGVEPPLADQAGHAMITLLSLAYEAVNGPTDSDFRMGTSRVPMHMAKRIVNSQLEHVRLPSWHMNPYQQICQLWNVPFHLTRMFDVCRKSHI